MADVFVKAAHPAPTLTIPKATSRADLKSSLQSHPKSLSVLDLELDTLGEDWLLALQDELTKPYFTSVRLFDTRLSDVWC